MARTHETGEIKRVVSALLLQIDDLPSYTVVVTATNHHELLDRAVWRRFQIKLELPLPDRKSLCSYFEKFFLRYNEPTGVSMAELSKRLIGVSFAEAEEFCLDIQRRLVLSLGQERLQDIVASKTGCMERPHHSQGELNDGTTATSSNAIYNSQAYAGKFQEAPAP